MSSTHGRLYLKNGAIIEHAENGIMNGESGAWDKNGGIINCSNTSFINCKRAASFGTYQNYYTSDPSILKSDRSQFINCEFKWNDNFRDDTPLGAHVTLYKVYGVSFLGCDFHDTRTTPEINGVRIYSLDAKYRVIGRCLAGPSGDCSGGPLDLNWDEGTFWGLKTGIRAYNSHTLNSFVVDHCANSKSNSNSIDLISKIVAENCRIVITF